MTLIKLLEAARVVGRWAFEHLKDTLILLLALLLAFMGWRLNREKVRSQELTAKIQGLPPDTQQAVTIYRDRIVTKWRDGPTHVEYRDRYLPPEGQIQVTTKIGSPDKQPEIVVKDHGLTSRLGGGIVYAGEPLPLLDLKWAYWRRYSLTAGVTPRFGGLGVSRHVDDFTPFDNLEILGMGGVDWAGNPRLSVGIRTNF